MDGFLTRQARRLVTLVGVEHSFARGQQLLAELCGWQVDDEVIRRTTHAEARRVAAERPERADAAPFAAAQGAVEVLIDAGKVNTRTAGGMCKVGLFVRREAGVSASADEWDRRDLPDPHGPHGGGGGRGGGGVRRPSPSRVGSAGGDDGRRRDGARGRGGVDLEPGGGAPAAGGGVLDVYHLLGTRGRGGGGGRWRAVRAGEASVKGGRCEAARRAGGRVGRRGWSTGWAGCSPTSPADAPTDPLLALAGYLAKHPTRLGYAGRLATGRSIGSGAVEGAIKQQVNLRLKRTGAGWRVEHVGPLVELRALSHTPTWHTLWTAA